MSRHRNVRSMNPYDEFDGYDDVYGHSVEDDSCISPSDAAFMYDRTNSRQTQISAFLAEEEDIAEEDESGEPLERRQSDSFKYPQLSDVDEARLRSCLDEIHSVIGDSISENIVVDTILQKNFDLALSLDALLKSTSNKEEKPKPQRVRRPRGAEKGKVPFNQAKISAENFNIQTDKTVQNCIVTLQA